MNAVRAPEPEDVGRDLASWLKEAGKRKGVAPLPELAVKSAAPAVKDGARATSMRRLIILGGLAGAYLQYFFMGVMLQIASMHSVVLFVAVAATQ